MLPTRTMVKVILSVLRPISVERVRLIIDPARASNSPIGAKRPMNITRAVDMLKNGVFPAAPRKSDPLLAAAEVNSQNIRQKPTDSGQTPMADAGLIAYSTT